MHVAVLLLSLCSSAQTLPNEASRLISLRDSLLPLQERFNADHDKLRLVAILSPT